MIPHGVLVPGAHSPHHAHPNVINVTSWCLVPTAPHLKCRTAAGPEAVRLRKRSILHKCHGAAAAAGADAHALPVWYRVVHIVDSQRVEALVAARAAATSASAASRTCEWRLGRLRQEVLDPRERERGIERHAVVRKSMVQVDGGPVRARVAARGVGLWVVTL